VAGQAPDWIVQQFTRKFEEKSRSIGRFNLAIFGKTGVGKSTLLNAIFGGEVAETGIGRPVTQGSHLYMHVSGYLGVLDTRGLEIGRDTGTIVRELEEFVGRMRRLPLQEQIHAAWYCVRSTDNRFEDTEEEFIRALDRLGLPVLLVLTQVPFANGRYHPAALELAASISQRRLPLHGEPIFLTYAQADSFHGYQAHGLQQLLDATFRVAPEGVKNALTAAQKIDMGRKRADAHKAITAAAASAAAVGAIPIPFSDAAILVPIQLAMMASIAIIYDVRIDRATAAAVAATAAATTGGRSLVTGLIKLVPGVGSIIGGTIAAGVASGITLAIGQSWMVVCGRISRGELSTVSGTLDANQVREAFMAEFQKNMRRSLPASS
jgi:uncharacterized protein (DUF697 family)/GTP-binding protein EngB required for normal cell division